MPGSIRKKEAMVFSESLARILSGIFLEETIKGFEKSAFEGKACRNKMQYFERKVFKGSFKAFAAFFASEGSKVIQYVLQQLAQCAHSKLSESIKETFWFKMIIQEKDFNNKPLWRSG